MEEKIQQIIDMINSLNKFTVQDIISILALIASWITIWFLLRDKMEANRPYLQISFELIRSNLACVVIRNTGNVPVSLCQIQFDENFVKQLKNSDEKRLFENGITDLRIFPNRQWIMCLGVIVPEILKFENTVMHIKYTYKRIGKRKKYSETTEIDFKQYGKCLVYISEIDELREVNRKMARDVKELRNTIKSIKAVVTQYINIGDTSAHNVVSGYEISKSNKTKKRKHKSK